MTKKLNLPKINSVIVSGRLTRDVDLRYTASGTPVATIGIANDRAYRDSDGNWQNETNFFRVTAWTKLAERASENFKKGSPVIVEGRLSWKSWQDKDDNKRTAVEIVASRILNLEREVDTTSEPDSDDNPEVSENTKGVKDEDEVPF